ncbi:glutaredoxin [Mycena sanguinolenta]|nr:glutaredoxin [Mycena sanguinolenta]
MAVKEFVESSINDNKITIFAKTWCPHSKKTKELFKAEFPDENPLIIDVDLREDEAEIQDYLLEKTGQRTVPNVFVNQKQIGGNDKTQAAFQSGELKRLVSL